MHKLPADVYDWMDHMERTSERSYVVDGMHVFEMDNRTNVVLEERVFVAYVRMRSMGRSG